MSYRTRTELGAAISVKPIAQNFGGSNGSTAPIQTAAFVKMTETIADESGQPFVPKPCTHYLRTVSPLPSYHMYRSGQSLTTYTMYNLSGSPRSDKWGTGTYGPWYYPIQDLPLLYPFDAASDTHRWLGAESDLVDRALKAMWPGIKPKLSLVNSLLELKDFKSLPKTVARAKAAIAAVTRSRSKRTLRQLLRSTADGYLQASFNLLPLLSDIRGIRATLSDTRQQIKSLLANEGRIQRRRYTTLLHGYDAETTQASSTSNGSYYSRLGRRVYYPNPRFCATMVYEYKIPALQKELALLNGYLDSLGVNLNPAILWNAIPWSFVVDWVLGVSQWLDRFSRRNIEPVVHLHSFCVSAHVTREITGTIQYNTTGDVHPPSQIIDLFRVYEEAYVRFPFTRLQFNASLSASGLSLRELSLGAALKFSR